MSAAIGLFAKGVLLGLGAAVPIGPVNVQIARHALRNGFGAGFALGCGAVTVDVMYAVLASLGLEHLTLTAPLDYSLRAGGIALLTYLGVTCLRGEREAWRHDPIPAGQSSAAIAPVPNVARVYTTGVLMTLLNPMTLAFWFVAVPALVGPVTAGDRRDLPLVCIGVFAGTVCWVVFFAGVLSLAGRFRRNWWLAAADAAGGAAMLVFAAFALLSSLQSFL